METQHDEVKAKFEKVAVGLEIEKQSLEKECEAFQVVLLLFSVLQ